MSGRLVPLEPAISVIPAGWYLMGDDSGALEERPAHRVYLDAFGMATTTVTNRQYAALLEATGHAPPARFTDPRFNHPEQPVVAVSWLEAAAYCHWIATVTGKPYRLPTEAEWEKAARGGLEGKQFPWGEEAPEARPDHLQRANPDRPEPVARYAPNGYGLYNTENNVHEWCADWYDPGYYAVSPDRNPPGPPTGVRRASRGGSWRHQIPFCRCAHRSSLPPDRRFTDYGFRLALTLPRDSP